jgi:hypothetical protein
MTHRRQFEPILDWAAALWIAGAVAFSAARLLPEFGVVGSISALAAGAVGGVIAVRFLATLKERTFPLPTFQIEPLEWIEPEDAANVADELLLTSRMRLGEGASAGGVLLTLHEPALPSSPVEELLLKDVLVRADPNSRVVQLFDPARMPTAGELKSRIDRHLAGDANEPSRGQKVDASQALYDALADLRRSLA